MVMSGVRFTEARAPIMVVLGYRKTPLHNTAPRKTNPYEVEKAHCICAAGSSHVVFDLGDWFSKRQRGTGSDRGCTK